MKHAKESLVSLLSTLMCATAFATGIVTNVSIRQVRPWQGMVEVDYELTEDRSSDPGLSTTVTFMDQQNDKVYGAKTFTHPFTYTKGAKRMIWNAAKDNVAFKSSNVVCKVEVKRELYCVIDLSGGTNATSYPVTTLSAVPEGGWTHEYKTSKLVLRYIEPGTFMMGSPENELGRRDGETQHQVSLTDGYYIGIFEVTQRQWELVVGNRPSYYGDANSYATLPVEQVSYCMIEGLNIGEQKQGNRTVAAESFIGMIRAKTGLMIDLPTEVQWEYACRAGTATALNSGKNLTSTDQCSNLNEVGRYRCNGGETVEVGSYKPNSWGLYDMHGNVFEACIDWRAMQSGESDPLGYRCVRGGCWMHDAYMCRSATRMEISLSHQWYGSGFRLFCPTGNCQ